jgi:hypothetical protein
LNSLSGDASIGNLTPTRGRRRIELVTSSETGGQAAPRLRRTMTLTVSMAIIVDGDSAFGGQVS